MIDHRDGQEIKTLIIDILEEEKKDLGLGIIEICNLKVEDIRETQLIEEIMIKDDIRIGKSLGINMMIDGRSDLDLDLMKRGEISMIEGQIGPKGQIDLLSKTPI